MNERGLSPPKPRNSWYKFNVFEVIEEFQVAFRKYQSLPENLSKALMNSRYQNEGRLCKIEFYVENLKKITLKIFQLFLPTSLKKFMIRTFQMHFLLLFSEVKALLKIILFRKKLWEKNLEKKQYLERIAFFIFWDFLFSRKGIKKCDV